MKTVRRVVPSEAFECQRFVDYLKSKGLRFTHIANETTSKKQAIKNKRLGTSRGVPDYLILIGSRAVWIEMKRTSGGRVSADQSEWIQALWAAGQPAYVCPGFEAAKSVIERYLNGQKTA